MPVYCWLKRFVPCSSPWRVADAESDLKLSVLKWWLSAFAARDWHNQYVQTDQQASYVFSEAEQRYNRPPLSQFQLFIQLFDRFEGPEWHNFKCMYTRGSISSRTFLLFPRYSNKLSLQKCGCLGETSNLASECWPSKWESISSFGLVSCSDSELTGSCCSGTILLHLLQPMLPWFIWWYLHRFLINEGAFEAQLVEHQHRSWHWQ